MGYNINPDGLGMVRAAVPAAPELLIEHQGAVYAPLIHGGVTLSLERKCAPGRLDFTVVKDSVINFSEGSHVSLRADGVNMFYGRVFSKQRGKNGSITVTAYDQLRYFKNKDTIVYEDITATELVRRLAANYGWETGTLDDTGYIIESRIEKDKTIFDIVQNALELTYDARGELYALYDDFGKLTLKNTDGLKLDLLVTEASAENFDYKSSIDGSTYNKIKLVFESRKGRREIFTSQDSVNIGHWGTLQFFQNIDETVNGAAMADALLKLYNVKTRALSIQNAFGDARVRAGAMLPVMLNLGDIILNNYMLVERVKHVFHENYHRMSLDLSGGGFNV